MLICPVDFETYIMVELFCLGVTAAAIVGTLVVCALAIMWYIRAQCR